MLLSVGTKVRLKNTKSIGIVTGFLDTGMLRIQLQDSGMEIPVFEDDIERIAEAPGTSKAKAKIVPAKQEKKTQAFLTQEIQDIPKTYPLGNKGLFLVFIPDGYAIGDITRFGIYLVNDTPQNLSFSISCQLKETLHFKRNAKLHTCQVFHLGSLDFYLLNDNPLFTCEIWELTDKGSSSKISSAIKLRPRSFFKAQQQVPFLETMGYAFPVLEEKEPRNEITENLLDYTQKHVTPGKTYSHKKHQGSYRELHTRASFPNEIDLHIEKLVVDSKKIQKKSVLDIQLQHFEAYLDKAIQLGLERVFIIHGLGEGKLRDAIASRLLRYREVKTFKNEYHPRYGFGATEVIIK